MSKSYGDISTENFIRFITRGLRLIVHIARLIHMRKKRLNYRKRNVKAILLMIAIMKAPLQMSSELENLLRKLPMI